MTGWREQAACLGMDVNLFFPDVGDSKSVAKAKLVCQQCPVRQQCHTHAIERPEPYGVWGGMSRDELRRTRGTGKSPVWFQCAWCGLVGEGHRTRTYCSRSCASRAWEAAHPDENRERRRLAKQRLRELRAREREAS